MTDIPEPSGATRITICPDGPLLVRGPVEIVESGRGGGAQEPADHRPVPVRQSPVWRRSATAPTNSARPGADPARRPTPRLRKPNRHD